MSKPDPALLDPARYPFSCQIPSRYGDLDPNGHINNVAMTGILEDARLRILLACAPEHSLGDWRIMTVSLSVTYLGQGYYPQPVEVMGGFTALGRSSFTMVQYARQGERAVAHAQTVLVWVADGHAAPLPEAFRSALHTYMIRA